MTILVADDENNMLTVLKILLESNSYRVLLASDGIEALKQMEKHPEIDLILSDLKMPGMDGISLLREMKKMGLDIPFVFMSAFGTIEQAVEGMKLGAADFIIKPFNKELILHTVKRLFSMESLKKENTALRESQKEQYMIFRSPQMKEIVSTLRKIAESSAAVLVTGESGCGKEVIARTLHQMSSRERNLPFISVNCPAVPDTLFESELFGYGKGAFTGADSDFPGKARLADGGTLFLDEIGDLPLQIQPKLLRMIEDKVVEPLGSKNQVRINTRIICATNRSLTALVEKGLFRNDLYYRINTFHIGIPPLRERREDIAPLAEYFLDRFATDLGKGEKRFSPRAMERLENHSWPGNVRELRNVIERSIVLSSGDLIGPDDFPDTICHSPKWRRGPEGKAEHIGYPAPVNLYDMERNVLLGALENSGGNITSAARSLGITRNTMRYRLKKYGISDGPNAPYGGLNEPEEPPGN